MAYGNNPITGTQTTLPNNQFPASSVYPPNIAGSNPSHDFKALGGGPIRTDDDGNPYSEALMYIKDGDNVAQGSQADAAVTNPALSASEIALLKGLLTKLNTLVTNSPVLGQAAMTASAPVVIANNQSAVPVSGSVSVGNFPGTQTVSGTVTANVGTTNGLALDTSVNGVIVAQGSTTSGEKGALVQGAVTTTAPAYTNGQTSPISLTQTGAVRTDASATTQPVSGTVQANAGTNLNTSLLALESGGNLASAKADLDTIVTNTNKIPASPAQEGGNLATLVTNTNAFKDTSTTGTVTNLNDVVSMALPGGQATTLVQILMGTLVGTLNFEVSPDSGTTWYAISGNAVGSLAFASTATAAGAWRFNVSGFTNFRVRLSPVTSGTSGTITIRLSNGVNNLAISNASSLGAATIANSSAVNIASDQIVPVKGSDLEVAYTTTTVQSVGSTDAGGRHWISVQIASQGTGSTVTFQGSNDNATWISIVLTNSTNTIQAGASSSATAGVWHGPLPTRYFRLNVTGISAGTTAGTIEFFAESLGMQAMGVTAGISGIWTVQPGNTVNTSPWLVTQVNNNASVPTGAANTVVKASAGAIGNIVVTTAGTGAGNVNIFDNATTNSGTPLFAFPATVSVGQAYQFNGWAKAGITAQNVLNGPVFTVFYS